MTTEAERIPVEDRYLRMLGRATYNFASLEWGIVWLTETTEPGFLNEVRNLTAGQIAKRFSRSTRKLAGDTADLEALQALALSFEGIVDDRNRLMHGNPFSAVGGEQRLLYDGRHGRKDWTIELIADFASRTATASIEAGRLLRNGRLERYNNREGP